MLTSETELTPYDDSQVLSVLVDRPNNNIRFRKTPNTNSVELMLGYLANII